MEKGIDMDVMFDDAGKVIMDSALRPEQRKRRIVKRERARRQALILTPHLPAGFHQAVSQLREEKKPKARSAQPPSRRRTISTEVIALLGPRVKQVAELVNAGEGASSIAETLKITHVSVKTHFKTINRKTRELSAQAIAEAPDAR